MRTVIYWRKQGRLVYLDRKATSEFWDEHWKEEGPASDSSGMRDVVAVTREYLNPASRVLEGGCGRGDKVNALARAGFNAVGFDFAVQSVAQAKLDYPGMDFRNGDVRSLPIPEKSFDGYWSIGVIEHFWDGYQDILAEASRVLRPGGFLFLTAPWLSPYRLRKIRRGDYAELDFDVEPPGFYQFALRRSEVCDQLAQHDFRLVRWSGVAPDASLIEDSIRLRRPVQWLLGSRGSILKRVFRRALLESAANYCGHSFLAIATRIS